MANFQVPCGELSCRSTMSHLVGWVDNYAFKCFWVRSCKVNMYLLNNSFQNILRYFWPLHHIPRSFFWRTQLAEEMWVFLSIFCYGWYACFWVQIEEISWGECESRAVSSCLDQWLGIDNCFDFYNNFWLNNSKTNLSNTLLKRLPYKSDQRS